MRFADDYLEKVETALELAVKRAAENQATALLLPEYAIPRRFADTLSAIAKEQGIGLIGGLEATTFSRESTDLQRYAVNQAVIQLPGVNQPYYAEGLVQNKRAASAYEPELFGGSDFTLFEGSPLGNFGVVLCSDYREMDILTAFADAGELIDCFFVCAMNPHPRLFEQLAIADAHRLHAFVVVANNFHSPNDDIASSDGSVMCCPMREPTHQVQAPENAVELGIPAIGGKSPAIAFFEIPVGKLQHNSARPPKGFLPAPQCRRKGDSLTST
jgi:predicted amidohydrolase